jgi:hypothetical protein
MEPSDREAFIVAMEKLRVFPITDHRSNLAIGSFTPVAR